MKLTILDASVALKWFFQEKDSDKASSILDEVQDHPEQFVVPELFFNETLHVFCKEIPEKEKIIECIEALQNLGLTRLGNGHEVLKKAVEISKTYQIGGYDSIYAANAFLLEGVWLTADEKAHRKIEKLKISKFL